MLTQHDELTGLMRVLKYYGFFGYAATAADIHIAYPYRITKKQLETILEAAIKEGRILSEKIAGTGYYTMPSHGISLHEVSRKIATAEEKMRRVLPFLQAIRYLAPVSFIGLSGSLAMNNTGKNDDVDFFVISAPRLVWTARFLLLLVASVLGLRRRRGEKSPSGKVCLNLFFDGNDLQVPEHKRNLYIAHEIVHMKPQFVRGDMYERFLEANAWIYDFLPNAQVARGGLLRPRPNTHPAQAGFASGLPPAGPPARLLMNGLELVLKKLQQFIIAQHRTNELISNTQMWFYPDDFEEKLHKSKII